MAKRSRTTTTNNSTTSVVGKRANPVVIANSPLRLPRPMTPPVFPLILLEDRRTFHPDGPRRYPAAFKASAVQQVFKDGSGRKNKALVRKSSTLYTAPPQYVGFRQPNSVAICIRRKVRRQVLLAFGRGGAGNRKGKRTYKSKFHCN